MIQTVSKQLEEISLLEKTVLDSERIPRKFLGVENFLSHLCARMGYVEFW
jgi:hypothetical protein